MDLMYSGWAMTQGSEGLNCLVVVHVPSVPHAAALSHRGATFKRELFLQMLFNLDKFFPGYSTYNFSLRRAVHNTVIRLVWTVGLLSVTLDDWHNLKCIKYAFKLNNTNIILTELRLKFTLGHNGRSFTDPHSRVSSSQTFVSLCLRWFVCFFFCKVPA